MSTNPRFLPGKRSSGERGAGGIRPTLLGLASGAMFALSAVGFRGAILSLAMPNYGVAASFTLAVGIVMQAVLLSLYLALRQRSVLLAIVRAWKRSLFAGFAGALLRSSGFSPSRWRAPRMYARSL